MVRLQTKMLSVVYCVPLETPVGDTAWVVGLGKEARSSNKKTIWWWIIVGGAAAALRVRLRAEVSSVWVTLVVVWASGGISQSEDRVYKLLRFP